MSAVLTGEASVLVESVLLGPLALRRDTVITFATGLPGFASLTRFALVETQRDDLVWLQSLDDTGITFLLADPFALVPGFEMELPAADLAAFGGDASASHLLVLAVAQLEGGAPVSANLQSPVVIDRDRRIGRQVVLPDSRYGMQHPISLA
ncbi:MAG: flagellar assembly protein FliW [Gemmatimonadaceae bacterium]|nr:flagellar assembly protein FliW [Gemmatimonadaceae bacterium]